MSKLNWRAATRAELSLLLKQARLDHSQAVGSSTVYHLSLDGAEMLAVSLPDGSAVIVEPPPAPRIKRRRADPAA